MFLLFLIPKKRSYRLAHEIDQAFYINWMFVICMCLASIIEKWCDQLHDKRMIAANKLVFQCHCYHQIAFKSYKKLCIHIWSLTYNYMSVNILIFFFFFFVNKNLMNLRIYLCIYSSIDCFNHNLILIMVLIAMIRCWRWCIRIKKTFGFLD